MEILVIIKRQTTVRISSKETIKSMDRLAIIQKQKIDETTVRVSIKCTIESIDRLALIHGQKVVERRVRFSIK